MVLTTLYRKQFTRSKRTIESVQDLTGKDQHLEVFAFWAEKNAYYAWRALKMSVFKNHEKQETRIVYLCCGNNFQNKGKEEQQQSF